MRPSQRQPDQLRTVRITRNFVLGREVSINDGNTSAILTVLVNGVRRLG